METSDSWVPLIFQLKLKSIHPARQDSVVLGDMPYERPVDRRCTSTEWFQELATRRGAGHTLEAVDDVRARTIGFLDLDTNEGLYLPLTALKGTPEEDFLPLLPYVESYECARRALRTVEGRCLLCSASERLTMDMLEDPDLEGIEATVDRAIERAETDALSMEPLRDLWSTEGVARDMDARLQELIVAGVNPDDLVASVTSNNDEFSAGVGDSSSETSN